VRRNFVVLHPDGRLQVGLAQNLGQAAAELAVHHDVDVGVHQVAHLGQMAPSGITMLTSAPMPSTRRRISAGRRAC
jgi:hypothetical protein